MKTILISILIFFTSLSFANESDNVQELNWKIVCSDFRYMIDILKEFDERPIAIGKMGRAGKMTMLINSKTGTWTLIGYSDKGVCIMAAGDEAQQIEPVGRN